MVQVTYEADARKSSERLQNEQGKNIRMLVTIAEL